MIEGFKELYIRDVPFGEILNKETADLYKLIPSGTFYSPNLQYFVQPESNGKWTLGVEGCDMRKECVKKYWECPECSGFWNSSLEQIERLYNKYLKD